MHYLADLAISGLAIGAIYGLVAMGFACIYKATGVVNFAQGEMMMLVTYLTASALLHTGWPYWAGLLLAPLIGIALGLAVERLVVRPMLGQPAFAIVMATIGLAVMLRALIGLVWGSAPIEFPGGLPRGIVPVAGTGLYPAQIAALVLFAAALAGAHLFLQRSRIGIAMRATAIDEWVTLLMGVDVRRVAAIAWCLAAALSGLAGVLFAAVAYVGPSLFTLGLKAFPASILGGLDAVLGSGVGGLVIGVVENLVGGYLDSSLREIAGFAVIIAVLLLRPSGLFGARDIGRV